MRRSIVAVPLGLLSLGLSEAASAQLFSGGIDLLEYHFDGDKNLLLDGALAYGGETDSVIGKLVVGGSVGQTVDQVDGQLLYSRSIAQGFSLEAGVRHEFRAHPRTTYAVAGFAAEPLAGVALESYAFVSQSGQVLGEAKLVYERRLARQITLQPRVAFRFAAQPVREQHLASGFTAAELGLRLRYDLTRAFAPYVGISHKQLLGKSAELGRAGGDVVRSTHLVAGFSSAF
jgi:copper resistance protein B